MKKIFLFFTAAFFAAGVASAQDINKAIELANNGTTAFGMGEYQLAIDAYQQSLSIAEALGEDGINVVNTCKTALSNIHLAISRNLLKEGSYEEALAKLNETIAIAQGYENADVVEQANGLIPNVYMAMGNTALKAKDMDGAIAAYTKTLEINPTNGDAHFYLGRAYAAKGDIENAIASFETAALNGEEANAKKQLSNIFVKKAQACMKAKDNQGAIENALKSNEYLENANAYKIAANCSQKLGKNTQCISYYEKYLEVKPNANDASSIIFTIGALYQQMGNKAKAIEYYKKVANDPKHGQSAQEQLKALQK